MYKKSLFLGAAALALLVLFAFVGCSNPSSSDTEYVTQASSDYPYPADTVFVDNRDALDGLLNAYDANTNQVQNIAYRGLPAVQTELADLIIPAGKTVYFVNDYDSATIAGNITVREGAKLVLVGNFTAGGGGSLLVRGTVEVYRSLTVTTDARDVADYSVENVIATGRNTVIGTHATILPGAILTLHVDDIIPPTESQPNKFTPAQAWAAAGQGHLVIGTGGSTPGVPDATFADELIAYYYTVKELLTGVYPNASRSYTVTSGRFTAEELPATIPQGAFILTRATPRTSEGNTLTVNGWLTTEGTLNDITQITLGNGGFLDLAEPTGNFLTGLTNLKVGPGAIFTVSASNGVLLESLDTLFLGDGSAIDISQAGTTVTFNDDTPIDLTVGKNVFYSIGMSPSAVVDTVISRDGSLVGASTLIVYPGSSFTVADGATFTVDGTSTFDISRQPIPPTGDTSPIVINGTLEVTETATFIGPDFATVQADPAALYETINLGPNGKVVLNDGATFTLGNSALAPNLVGAANAPYTWTGNDGAQIEINSGGIIIRDTDSTLDAAITVAGPGAGILKGQSLTLERGVTLSIDVGFALYLFGGTDVDGAKLLGPGTLEVGTIEFTGNDYGWQAIGDNIAIADDGIGGQYIAAYPAVTPATSPIAATLKAADNRGGAIISIPASVTLEIRGGVTVDLNGSMARKNGEIRLASGAIISLVNSTSVILTGAGPASHTAGVPLSTASAVTTALDSVNVVGLTGANASGVSETLASTTAVADVPHTSLPRGKLVSLTGGDDTTPLPGTVTATAVVNINSELDTEATP